MYPVDGVGVGGDLLGVQEGAELGFMVLQQQAAQVEGPALLHTVPAGGEGERQRVRTKNQSLQEARRVQT